MHNRRERNVRQGLVICYLVIQFAALPSFGQGMIQDRAPDRKQLSAIVESFKDRSWQRREEAFYKLLGYESVAKWDGRSYLIPAKLASIISANPSRGDELKLALIGLLNTENAYHPASGRATEEYVNYYGDVIAAVTALKDARALEAVVGALVTGGMVDRALAEFGPVSLDPLILKLGTSDVFVRAAAVRALTMALRPEYRNQFNDLTSQQKIKSALLRAANDSDGGVRFAAVYGLALIPNRETVLALTKMANSDPSKLPGQADEGGDFYPVRRAAKMALDDIARTGGPTASSPN